MAVVLPIQGFTLKAFALAYAFALLIDAPQFAVAATTSPLDLQIARLETRWAHLTFEIHDRPVKADEAARLAQDSHALALQYPARPEPLVWEAVACAAEAGARGGVDALVLVGEARKLLERAEPLATRSPDDAVIYSSLGVLYGRAPGFPIGFGDAAKARAYFGKALALDPDGARTNLLYGEFLIRHGDSAGGRRALERVLAALPRPGQAVEDKGLRASAARLLSKLRPDGPGPA